MLWQRPGGGVIDDQKEEVPAGATQVRRYRNPYQFTDPENQDVFQWSPEGPLAGATFRLPQSTLEYGTRLLRLAEGAEQGTLKDDERTEWEQMRQAALAVPMRDPTHLEGGGYRFYHEEVPQASRLEPNSPDLGALLLTMRDKVAAGTATPHEEALYRDTAHHLNWQQLEAADPSRDGSPFGLSNPLMMALLPIAMGATGGMALAPLLAGGAGLATTLGSLGTLAGTVGSIGNLVAPAIDQDWFTRVTQGLGAAGGIAGGIGGLANLAGTGIQGLGDVARLASNAGRVVGGIGTLTDSDVLRQGGGYLGAAGSLGSGANTIADVFGGGVGDLTDAARLASAVGQIGGVAGRLSGNRRLQQASSLLSLGGRLGGNVQGLLGAAGQAQQRGTAPVPRTMQDDDWLGKDWQPGPWQQPQPVLWNL